MESWGPISFRFELAWLQVDGFKELVEQWWRASTPVGQKGGYCLLQKLKFVKGKMKLWAQARRGEEKVEEHAWLEELQSLHQLEEVGVLPQEQLLRMKGIKISLKKKALREEIQWKQRSRLRWLKEGDKNTKFIHHMASARRRKNYIHPLQVDGERIDNRSDICEEVVLFYQKLYKAPLKEFPVQTLFPFKVISEEQRVFLESTF